ncbi:MAG TPA: PfkB family carbohydrate kinase [Kofleriaceae bacterium]|nr:PfkB family carbohydrate kinase [Kofleriaceae bacterium]
MLVAWGEILWDLFPSGPLLGGAPANLAYHLAVIGAEVALVSRVGADEPGREALERLGAAGVDVSAVQRDAGRPTGSVRVDVEGGEARYSLNRGGAWEYIELDAAARALIARSRAICFGSLAQRRPGARAALTAALAARPPGCLAVCDLNLRRGEQDSDLVRWALEQADLLKINEREERQIAALFGVRDPVAWLLGELGAAQVALTRGAAGCSIIDRSGARVDQPGVPAAPGGDTVGCGDAFTAVWVHLHLAGAPPARIAEAACRYATFVASRPGATPAVPAEVAAAVAAAAAGRSADGL